MVQSGHEGRESSVDFFVQDSLDGIESRGTALFFGLLTDSGRVLFGPGQDLGRLPAGLLQAGFGAIHHVLEIDLVAVTAPADPML